MKIEIGNIRFRFDCSISKLADVDGINSNIFFLGEANGNHILLWDFDNTPLQIVIDDLRCLQHLFDLPKIHIIESSPEHYHAYCFSEQRKSEAIYILSLSPHIDQTYFKLGIIRGYWTLRITPKKRSDLFKPICILDSEIPEDFTLKDMLQTVKYRTRL